MLNGSRPLVRPGSSISGDSAVSAVDKPKRKRQRLDHLTQDEKIMRRKMKNRMAAQTARDRKKLKMTDLELEVTRQSHTNEQLVKKNALLTARLLEIESENRRLKAQLRRLGHTPEAGGDESDAHQNSPNTANTSQAMLSLLDELGDDIDIDMDEFLKLDNSDVASDDSGYLFSDHSSPSDSHLSPGVASSSSSSSSSTSSTSSIGSASPTGARISGGPQSWNSPPTVRLSAASAVSSVNALESAAFINEPQQQEQVLTAGNCRRPDSRKASGYPVIRTATDKFGPRSLLAAPNQEEPEAEDLSMATPMAALWRIAELELASLSSSSGVKHRRIKPQQSRPTADDSSTVGQSSPQPQPQSQRSKKRAQPPTTTTTQSLNGRLKTLLFLLSAILVLI